MNAGASPHLTDIRIHRLKAFQRAVERKFSAAVDRHKADIERQSVHFKEKFPIIARDIRRPEETPPEYKSETDPVDMAVDEAAPASATETPGLQLNAEKPFKNHRKPRPRIGRKDWIRGRIRSERATSAPPPATPSAVPQPPEDQDDEELRELERLQELEELRVLEELEKFQALQQQRALPQIPKRQEQPDFVKAQEPPKNKGTRFSIKRLFDLSPQFPQNGSDTDQDS